MTNNWTLDELVKGAVRAADMYGEDALEAGQDDYILNELNRGRLFLAFPDDVCFILNMLPGSLDAMPSTCVSTCSDLVFEDSRNEYRVWRSRGDDLAHHLSIEKYNERDKWHEVYTVDYNGVFSKS